MPECGAVAFAAGVRSRTPYGLLDPHDFVHGIVEGAFGLLFPDPLDSEGKSDVEILKAVFASTGHPRT